jgi:hypothetical protein
MQSLTSPAADMNVIKQAIDPLCPPVYLRTSCKDKTASFKLHNKETGRGALCLYITFHVNIERTLITPSEDPKATRGASVEDDLDRNSMLQKMES